MQIQDVKHFIDLIAWKKNHEFVLNVYLITKSFPREEMFGLTDQIRRASSSITANIAEGYGRYYIKDKLRFYYQARGSNTECQNHLILAHELNYIPDEDYNKIKIICFEGYKILCGLIKSTNNQINKTD
ncbi:MAG: four helix bundle protein [Candidatus Magasanikbacteria bacterium CG_4_10_14_0_8_um_filter_32_14]|uniref:Four helix bundle protein n=1 Tax=Candidatus Magasanikbacteria bacterium CG_4_10_14_0_8_um_filter_32_14 TaxID=1974640 RepID=A0A2M7R9L9_9BACT|nr:MAG: four helix bundle protein [Candidatus Magasanikbacteria bacterium CG_4_10_14_0_8_um_filter_32_14]